MDESKMTRHEGPASNLASVESIPRHVQLHNSIEGQQRAITALDELIAQLQGNDSPERKTEETTRERSLTEVMANAPQTINEITQTVVDRVEQLRELLF